MSDEEDKSAETAAKEQEHGPGKTYGFLPGNRYRFQPGDPRIKAGPGRPKKDAWVRELERELEASDVRRALARRILQIALKGHAGDSLRALQEIQDRTGGPVVKKVDADITVVPHSIELIDRRNRDA